MTTLNLKQDDFGSVVASYSSKRTPDHRYASFDYCYNYFRTTSDLTADMEKSCLVLGFYLASWGMYRGSSSILQRSVKYLQPTIKYIASQNKSLWEIDVDSYNDKNMSKIIDSYHGIKEVLIQKKKKTPSLTLVTKILLGVFGFVPAFDNLFCTTFRLISGGKCGFRAVNINALICIRDFYDANKLEIDRLSDETLTYDFSNGEQTSFHYPKAKIIDMYGFEFENLRKK